MSTSALPFNLAAVGLVLLGTLTGCSSDYSGSTHVHAGVSYGMGYYDPWYYGGGYYPPDVIVTPPPENPGNSPPRPAHPIVKPPPSGPRPTPMPSIPTRSRPRAGMRR
jgi:hypothetical protein